MFLYTINKVLLGVVLFISVISLVNNDTAYLSTNYILFIKEKFMTFTLYIRMILEMGLCYNNSINNKNAFVFPK